MTFRLTSWDELVNGNCSVAIDFLYFIYTYNNKTSARINYICPFYQFVKVHIKSLAKWNSLYNVKVGPLFQGYLWSNWILANMESTLWRVSCNRDNRHLADKLPQKKHSLHCCTASNWIACAGSTQICEVEQLYHKPNVPPKLRWHVGPRACSLLVGRLKLKDGARFCTSVAGNWSVGSSANWTPWRG